MKKKISRGFFLASLMIGSVFAQNMPGMFFITPEMIRWESGFGAGFMSKGIGMGLLQGDPSKPGPYVYRLNLPENSVIAPYTRNDVEQVTVISGSIYVGIGDVVDMNKATQLSAGSFYSMQPGTKHYIFTKSPAIIQLHGVGPLNIYLNDTKK